MVDAVPADAFLLKDGADAPTSLPNGSSCDTDGQCASSYCVDRVCCSTPCGQCHTCANATGICNEVGNSTSCGSTSGQVCYGGACTTCTSGLPCSVSGDECFNHATSCSTGQSQCVQTSKAQRWRQLRQRTDLLRFPASYGQWTCQAGACVQPAATTCPSTGCNTTSGLCNAACGAGNTAGPVVCGTTCCASNQFCMSNTNCGPMASPGSACPYGNAQCTTNYCVAGYCCNSSNCEIGQTCASGTCACAMSAATLCNTCTDWNFEWGTSPSPWLLDLDPNWSAAGNGTTSIAITSAVYHAGTGDHSLMAQISVDQSTSFQAEVAVKLSCATALGGYGFSAWVYLDGPVLNHAFDGLLLDTWNGNTEGDEEPLLMAGVPTGQWFLTTGTFSTSATAAVNEVGIRLTPSIVWSGQMYIDDVVITPP